MFFCFIGTYKAKKPSGGCALAREEIVAIATALGASVLRVERDYTGRRVTAEDPVGTGRMQGERLGYEQSDGKPCFGVRGGNRFPTGKACIVL